MRLLFTLILISTWFTGNTSGPSTELFDHEVCTAKGKCFDLSALRKNRATVIVFLQPDCPIAQKYTLTLREMVDTLALSNIDVIGIVPGRYYSRKELKKFAKKYKLNFPIYFDYTSALAKHMKAEVSPEAFLVDSSATVLYSGKIDNWFEALGVHRSVITKFYLKDAISSFLSGTEIAIKKTKAIGCFLEY